MSLVRTWSALGPHCRPLDRCALARRHRSSPFWQRLLGWTWLLGWICALWACHLARSDLGGLVVERTRWIEALVAQAAPIFGILAGLQARDRAAIDGSGYGHAFRQRFIPVGGGTALALAILRLLGQTEPVAIVVRAFIGLWAGFDAAVGALPLIDPKRFGAATASDSSEAKFRVEGRDSRWV